MEFSHRVHACVLAGAAMLARALAKGWLWALCFPAKKWYVMKIKPNHTRLRCMRQGKAASPSAVAERNQNWSEAATQSEDAMPNTGFKFVCLFPLPAWNSGHPLPSQILPISQSNARAQTYLEIKWRGWSLDVVSITHCNQLTFDRPNPFIPMHIIPSSPLLTALFFLSLSFFFFPFDCCKFGALDTWNSPARPPLKAHGSWSPLRNCAEDWLRHPVRSRAKRTLLPQDGALWYRWREWGDENEGGHISNSKIFMNFYFF